MDVGQNHLPDTELTFLRFQIRLSEVLLQLRMFVVLRFLDDNHTVDTMVCLRRKGS